jgi:hypothetical protein
MSVADKFAIGGGTSVAHWKSKSSGSKIGTGGVTSFPQAHGSGVGGSTIVGNGVGAPHQTPNIIRVTMEIRDTPILILSPPILYLNNKDFKWVLYSDFLDGLSLTKKKMTVRLKTTKKRPFLISHWDGYCVIRGPPDELYNKWYKMVYYAMCAGQMECCLMKLSFGTPKSDVVSHVNTTSPRVLPLTLNNRLKERVDTWCESQGISYYIKRPSDPTGYIPSSFGETFVQSDFVYLIACWEVPRGYKFECTNPFNDSSSE